jgi:hypothetical protein
MTLGTDPSDSPANASRGSTEPIAHSTSSQAWPTRASMCGCVPRRGRSTVALDEPADATTGVPSVKGRARGDASGRRARGAD